MALSIDYNETTFTYSPRIPKSLKLRLNQEDVDKFVKICLRESCKIVASYARKNHAFRNVTGNLESAIMHMKVHKDGKGKYVSGVMVDDTKAVNEDGTPYAKFLLHGTGIYGPRHRRIFPKNSKALRWFDKHNGSYHHAQYIYGIDPNKWGRFFENVLPRNNKIVSREIHELIQRNFEKFFNKIKRGR